MSKKMSLPTPLWNTFDNNFWLEFQNIKQILEIKVIIIYHINLMPYFWIKFNVLCLNEVWSTTLNTIPTFDLIISDWAPPNSNLHISHGLWYPLPPLWYKELCFSSLRIQKKWLLKLCEMPNILISMNLMLNFLKLYFIEQGNIFMCKEKLGVPRT